MWGGLPEDWEPGFHHAELEGEVYANYHRRPILMRAFGRGDHVRINRHIYLIGNRWYDHRAFAEASVDLTFKNRSKQYSGAIATTLLHFPASRKLDLVAGLVETFADGRSELGQAWGPVLNILGRNRGTLDVVW